MKHWVVVAAGWCLIIVVAGVCVHYQIVASR